MSSPPEYAEHHFVHGIGHRFFFTNLTVCV
jgi:hypothetical protein